MALWRSGARNAPRHTGREYGRGFQFGYPDRDTLRFGPWDSVWPLGDRDLPQNVLHSLKDGILVDGVILPVWNRSVSTNLNQFIVAASEMSIVGDRYSVILFRDAGSANALKAKYDNGVVSGIDISAITVGPERISMAPWQRYVYFVSPTIGSVQRYSPVDNAFATIAASPLNGIFAFILNNNLVIIRANGDIYEAVWSVDSLPEDFAGAGSGAAVLTGIGEPRGFGIINDRAIIIGSAGAKVMVPTGGLPAFAFQDVSAIEGTPFEHAVTSSEDKVFYFGYDYQLRAYTEGGVRVIGDGEGRLQGTPRIYYSRRLGRLVVSLVGQDVTLFLDVETGKWVSDLDVSWDFITDSPVVDATGLVLGLANSGNNHDETVLNLQPAGLYTLPRISFGLVTLPQEFVLEHIDIQRTNKNSPQPLVMTLERVTGRDFEQNDLYDGVEYASIAEIGEKIRYHINRPAASFKAEFYVGSASGVLVFGPYLLASMDANGNIPVDPTNPATGVRGDIDLDGNMDVDAASTEFFSPTAAFDVNGNLDLELAEQSAWLRNTGIVGMSVRIKKQSLEAV